MNRPKIMGIGELVWDLLPDGRQLGGAPVNFAYWCNRLGAEGYPVSAVGSDDPDGRLSTDWPRRDSISVTCSTTPCRPDGST